MYAGISGSVTKRSMKRTRARAPARRARAAAPSASAASRRSRARPPRPRAKASQQHVGALVGPDQPEGEDHRALDLAQLLRAAAARPAAGSGSRRRRAGSPRAWPGRPRSRRPGAWRRARCGRRRRPSAPAGRSACRPMRLPASGRRQCIVNTRGWTGASRRRSSSRDRQPLVVDDVGVGGRGGGGAAFPGGARPRAGPAARRGPPPARELPAVEELVDLVAALARDRAVRKMAGDSSTSAPARASAAAERMVVGRRVGRRIDDLDAHGGAFSPCCSPTAWSTPTAGRICSPAWTRSSAPRPSGIEREVLVLDNASADGSAEAVRALRRRRCG